MEVKEMEKAKKNGFTLTKECNYKPRIIEGNLIRRKKKAKKSSKSTTHNTSKAKFTDQRRKYKNQKMMEKAKYNSCKF